MYSLHLTCGSQKVDFLSAELWEAGTAGIRELTKENDAVTLIAGGFDETQRAYLLDRFSEYSPRWLPEAETDWVAVTQQAWPGRAVGSQLFIAPLWCSVATPPGRKRLVHNPGMASGTGEHPCTQLALEALEDLVTASSSIADIGTGSGILAIAARLLGASAAVGVDLDDAALENARENFHLNDFHADLVTGSVECLRSESFSIVAANISATVLLSVADELLRIVRPNGAFILTGFAQDELAIVERVFPAQATLKKDGWRGLISHFS